MEKTWLSRKKNDKVSIIGFSTSTRDLVPWDDPEMDFYTMNERYNWGTFKYENVTAHFQIHPYWNCMRKNNPNDPNHPEWLKKQHPFPIYMQKEYPDIPSSTRFPLEEAIKWFGRGWVGTDKEDFESGLAYMLVMAGLEGYKRVELYGFDMASGTEYFHQRANAYELLGFMRGSGIDVYIPPQSKLNVKMLYAYRSIQTGFRQTLEFRYNAIDREEKKSIADFNMKKGRVQFAKQVNAPEDLVKKEEDEARKAGVQVNLLSGARQELYNVMVAFDEYVGEGDYVQRTAETADGIGKDPGETPTGDSAGWAGGSIRDTRYVVADLFEPIGEREPRNSTGAPATPEGTGEPTGSVRQDAGGNPTPAGEGGRSGQGKQGMGGKPPKVHR